ncbi:MAG TPA: hypothetical protein VHO95_11435, partial [Candidatus Dormibacteraeota bacterium]|nr:hypothetical protein [Candidatus Dormibacteraeota bacterium]
MPTIGLTPILDSMFVGDNLPARKVTYYDSNGQIVAPPPITWTIAPDTVATIDAATGAIHGVRKGLALVTASASGATSGIALVAVSRTLDMTLLMDTVVMMPGDTLTLRPYLAIKQKVPTGYTVHYDTSPAPTVYTMDTTAGRITAGATSAAARYVARVTDGTNTVADTGAVNVLVLTDTSERGHFFESVQGTAIRHHGGSSIATNYAKLNSKIAFQLLDSAALSVDTALDLTTIVLRDSLPGLGTFVIDSLNPQEVGSRGLDQVVCTPPRPWGVWQSRHLVLPAWQIWGYSHGQAPGDSIAGYLVITHSSVVANGAIVGGRYTF